MWKINHSVFHNVKCFTVRIPKGMKIRLNFDMLILWQQTRKTFQSTRLFYSEVSIFISWAADPFTTIQEWPHGYSPGVLSPVKPSCIKSYQGFSVSITFLLQKFYRKYRCLPIFWLENIQKSTEVAKEYLKMKERDKRYGNK